MDIRTLRLAGKLKELTHKMDTCHWNMLSLCEIRWKNFGKLSSDNRYKVYISVEEDRREYVIVFLVHKTW